MGIFRKIEIRTWLDEKFRRLSPIPACGQGLWFYLLTGPQTGIIPGLFKAGHAAMAEDLGWDMEGFEKAFREVLREGLVKDSPKDHLIWVPKAIKYNPPMSPNVVRGWASALDVLPECPLLREAIEVLREAVYSIDTKENKGFAKAFEEAFGKGIPKGIQIPLPNQEQEQEQYSGEKEKNTHTPREGEKITQGVETAMPKAVYAAWAELGERVYQPGDYATVFAGRWGELRRFIQGIHSDDVLAGIANLGIILSGESGKYYWNQRITIQTFFEKHLDKFLPANFNADDFLSRKGPRPAPRDDGKVAAAKQALGLES